MQEVSEHNIQSESSREGLNITLLAGGWSSSPGGLLTLNRELAIHLSQHPKVKVSLLVPVGHCTNKEKSEPQSYGITVVGAEECPGWEPLDWLSAPPRDHKIDVVIGYGAKLGRQVPLIRNSDRYQNCKWVQVVHTDPEDLRSYKRYSNPTSRGQEKHEVEVALCKLADLVVPVGPRLKERYSSYLKRSKRDIFPLIPGLFARDFGDLEQSPNENAEFKVLLCGRGDKEDFEVEGYNLAVQAFADHRLQMKPYHLLFVGAPEGEQDEVRQRLLRCGIAKEQLTVRKFEQSRDKMKDLLCEVNLAIMPSRSEGFGLFALEALSAGLPILVSSKSGFARALWEIPFGVSCIVNSDEPAKWAEAIEGVRVRHKKRLEEIKLLRTSYDEQYSWQEQCGKLVEKLWTMVHGTGANVEVDSSGEQSPRKGTKRKISGSTWDQVKDGVPSELELRMLSREFYGDEWLMLGRVLNFPNVMLTAFDRQNSEDSEKAYQMLLNWKQRGGSSATYEVLYHALCSGFLERRDLAEETCCIKKSRFIDP